MFGVCWHYRAGLIAKTRSGFACLLWKDNRPKEDVCAVGTRLEAKTKSQDTSSTTSEFSKVPSPRRHGRKWLSNARGHLYT